MFTSRCKSLYWGWELRTWRIFFLRDHQTNQRTRTFEKKQNQVLLQWSRICFHRSLSGNVSFYVSYLLLYHNITSTFRYDSIRCFCFKQSRNTHEQRVCAKASLDDIVGQSDVLKCPDHCLAYRQITLNARDFLNGSNDDLLMNKTMHPNVKVSIVTTEVTRAGKMLFERK